MAKKKPRTSAKVSVYTLFHLRMSFFLIFFGLLFLFYPGDNTYIKIFSHNRELFDQKDGKETSFIVKDIPFVINKNVQPVVTAQGVYVIDLLSVTPVFEKNRDVQFMPASTAKIITALVGLDVFDVDDTLEVKRALDVGQTVGFIKGETFRFEDMLYALLIHSGNDAAYVIADNYPGGYAGFIGAMNKKAELLSMRNSSFKNPAGLDAGGQYTTAFDLTLAAREVLKNKTLVKIVSTKSITISDTEYNHFYPLYNVNKLLGEIPGVAGLKTGKTELAGENLITLYKHNDREYLIVILKSEDRFKDTQNMVEWLSTNIGYIEQ